MNTSTDLPQKKRDSSIVVFYMIFMIYMRRILNMKSKFLLISMMLTTLLLSSCLTMTTGLVHQSSGSGKLSLDYRINRKAAGIQKDSVTGENLIPLPVNKSDFDELVALSSGLSLNSFSETDDADFIYIKAELGYQTLNDLGSFFGFPVEYTSQGDIDTLVLSIYKGDSPIDSSTQSIINSLFSDDTLTFELTFPRNIKSSNFGDISGRTVKYSTPLPEVYRNGSFIWTIEW